MNFSSQSTEYQKEFVIRNHNPFEMLSDADFKVTEALKLPTFTYNEMQPIKRMALVLRDRQIAKVFCPVFRQSRLPVCLSSHMQKFCATRKEPSK